MTLGVVCRSESERPNDKVSTYVLCLFYLAGAQKQTSNKGKLELFLPLVFSALLFM